MTSRNQSEHPFEQALQVSEEDISILFRGTGQAPWASFLLNPRRLRGSDFLMRWSQGVWSEQRLTHAVGETGKFFALPYGPSGTAPEDDVRAFELYFERLEGAGLGNVKRPDLLVYRSDTKRTVVAAVEKLGGLPELPFTSEDDAAMQTLLRNAVVAVECENSLWCARRMPDFGTPLTPQRRLGGKLGMKKTAVLPTVIIKEQDRGPLCDWQRHNDVAIHIWHAFYDEAYAISLNDAEDLIRNGQIEPDLSSTRRCHHQEDHLQDLSQVLLSPGGNNRGARSGRRLDHRQERTHTAVCPLRGWPYAPER